MKILSSAPQFQKMTFSHLLPTPARVSVVVSLTAALVACSSGFDAVRSTVQGTLSRITPEAMRRAEPSPKLDPRFRYLRATVKGNATYLALGYELQDEGNIIEVWYSGTGEVLKLENGRIEAASGLFTEWRKVDLSHAPSWGQATGATGPLSWQRTRDLMPGYRYGVEDAMTLTRVPIPRKTELRGVDASQLAWFQETTATMRGAEVLPAIYGVEVQDGKVEVVYSEQCVAVDFCFSLQRWPAEKQAQK